MSEQTTPPPAVTPAPAPEPDFSDLTPLSFRKNVGGVEYHVTEAGTAAAKRFQNAQMAAYKLDDGKMVGAAPTFFDSEPQLVADCVYRVGPDGAPLKDPVGLAVVRGWPDRVTAWLFDRIKEMSPSLTGKQTADGVRRQIAKLQELLARLEAAGGDGPKAPPGGGGTASA